MRVCEHRAASVLCAPLATRAAGCAATAVACALYARLVHTAFPAGAPRLSAVMPVVALFCALQVRAAGVGPRPTNALLDSPLEGY